jgi:hypothetical protein
VATNVFNNMDNPKDVMQIVTADYTRSLDDKLYEISRNITNPIQYQNILNQNQSIQNQISNFFPPIFSSSSSSFSGFLPSLITSLLPSFFKKEEEIMVWDVSYDDDCDEEDEEDEEEEEDKIE